MGKYASWIEFEKNVPISLQRGKHSRGLPYRNEWHCPIRSEGERGTGQPLRRWVDGKGAVMVSSYKRAMFE